MQQTMCVLILILIFIFLFLYLFNFNFVGDTANDGNVVCVLNCWQGVLRKRERENCFPYSVSAIDFNCVYVCICVCS